MKLIQIRSIDFWRVIFLMVFSSCFHVVGDGRLVPPGPRAYTSWIDQRAIIWPDDTESTTSPFLSFIAGIRNQNTGTTNAADVFTVGGVPYIIVSIADNSWGPAKTQLQIHQFTPGNPGSCTKVLEFNSSLSNYAIRSMTSIVIQNIWYIVVGGYFYTNPPQACLRIYQFVPPNGSTPASLQQVLDSNQLPAAYSIDLLRAFSISDSYYVAMSGRLANESSCFLDVYQFIPDQMIFTKKAEAPIGQNGMPTFFSLHSIKSFMIDDACFLFVAGSDGYNDSIGCPLAQLYLFGPVPYQSDQSLVRVAAIACASDGLPSTGTINSSDTFTNNGNYYLALAGNSAQGPFLQLYQCTYEQYESTAVCTRLCTLPEDGSINSGGVINDISACLLNNIPYLYVAGTAWVPAQKTSPAQVYRCDLAGTPALTNVVDVTTMPLAANIGSVKTFSYNGSSFCVFAGSARSPQNLCAQVYQNVQPTVADPLTLSFVAEAPTNITGGLPCFGVANAIESFALQGNQYLAIACQCALSQRPSVELYQFNAAGTTNETIFVDMPTANAVFAAQLPSSGSARSIRAFFTNNNQYVVVAGDSGTPFAQLYQFAINGQCSKVLDFPQGSSGLPTTSTGVLNAHVMIIGTTPYIVITGSTGSQAPFAQIYEFSAPASTIIKVADIQQGPAYLPSTGQVVNGISSFIMGNVSYVAFCGSFSLSSNIIPFFQVYQCTPGASGQAMAIVKVADKRDIAVSGAAYALQSCTINSKTYIAVAGTDTTTIQPFMQLYTCTQNTDNTPMLLNQTAVASELPSSGSITNMYNFLIGGGSCIVIAGDSNGGSSNPYAQLYQYMADSTSVSTPLQVTLPSTGAKRVTINALTLFSTTDTSGNSSYFLALSGQYVARAQKPYVYLYALTL